MIQGAGLLLISAAVGYFVLERAEKHKGGLKRTGQLLGWVIMLVSLVGVACRVCYLSTWTPGAGFKGRYGPLFPKTAPMSPLPDSTPADSSP